MSRITEEDLVRRLPLPLAQLYHSVHRPHKTALEKFLAAFQLWEAAVKLLAAVAVGFYQRLGRPEPALQERLTNLARPALGHWWEFVRLLTPVAAKAGDQSFQDLQHLIFQAKLNDCPQALALDLALRQEQEQRSVEPRNSVRLQELFDRLVWLRNREMGHGALGQRKQAFYAQLGQKLLPAIVEILGRLDVLAGRRLIYVADVRRESSGNWLIERFELTGESGRLLEPLSWKSTETSRLPCPGRIYLEDVCADAGPSQAQAGSLPPMSLHPLVIYDADEQEVMFLNQRRGRGQIEYLCYGSGRTAEHPEFAADLQELLEGLVGMPVAGDRLAEWAQKAEAETALQEKQAVPEESAGTPAPVAPPVKARLGDFELLSILGEGGMGVVYRARQTSLGRQVALKSLHAGGNRDRFIREIRALGRVKHPNLVEIFTSGSDGQQWFYAMELVEGTTLAAVLADLDASRGASRDLSLKTWEESVKTACEKSRRAEKSLSEPRTLPSLGKRTDFPAPVADEPGAGRKPPSTTPKALARPTEAGAASATRSEARPSPAASKRFSPLTGSDYLYRMVELVRQAALAAHALHEKGVIHRDIKPGNIMVTPDGGHAVLMDLGLAKLDDASVADPTMTRQFMGTLRYASPEQVHSSKDIDCRADVYSLGATLWELLTFQAMHGASEDMSRRDVENRILFNDSEPIRKYNRRVPVELEAVVSRCLERDAGHRYPTALALALDLGRFLAGETVQARPVSRLRRTMRYLRRHPLQTAGIMALPVLLLAVLTVYRFWDAHYRTKVGYYTHFVNRWGVPHGIFPLREAEVGHRRLSWKIISTGGRVEKMEAVNGHGVPTTEHGLTGFLHRDDEDNREVAFQYKRNEQGDLSEEIALDRQGQVVWKFHYSTKTAGYHANKRGMPQARSGTGAAFVEFAYNDRGFAEEMRFLDKDGKPQMNDEHVFGMRRKDDDRGLAIEVRYVDEAGNPMVGKNGIARVTSGFDQQGNLIEMKFYDVTDQPALHKDGYAGWKTKYDSHGNSTEMVLLDQGGKPVLSRWGVAKVVTVRDEHGEAIEAAFFDALEKPVLHSTGWARWTARHDSFGNRIEQQGFDVAGKPALNKYGYCKSIAKFDTQGNARETTYYGADGKPTLIKFGYSRVTAEYDAAGNQTLLAYAGVDGKPAVHKDGYAKKRCQYDAYGNETLRAFFDADDRPTPNKSKVASYAFKYDDRGNIAEITHHDEDDRLTLSSDGYAKARITYDEQGNRIEAAYFGVDEAPVFSRQGFAKWTGKYDGRGQKIEEAFFGVDGKPTADRDGHARGSFRYDNRGNLCETAYFDLAGKPAPFLPGRYVKWTAVYDPFARIVELAYWGADGKPASHQDGHAKMTSKFDDRGNECERAFFGTDGKPTLIREGLVRDKKCGYHRWTAQSDQRGNKIETAFFGVDGKPALHEDGYARSTSAFDQRGNKIEVAFFGVDGKPAAHRDGYARWTSRHDERDNEIELAMWDVDGQPFVRKEGQGGYARRTARFNERGQRIAEAYFGALGTPARQKDGYTNATQEFDDKGRRVAVSLRGYDGKDGYFRADDRYNQQGLLAARTFYDEAGNLALIKDGFARRTSRYNNRGQEVERAFFGKDGSPVTIKSGEARYTCDYNERGQRTAMAFFDPDGKPVRHKEHGFTNWTKVYNADGKRATTTFWGFDGKDGFFRFVAQHNNRGEIVDMTYSDEAGKPAMHRDGYARWTAEYRYPDKGPPVTLTYFDAAGQNISKVSKIPPGLPRDLLLKDGAARVEERLSVHNPADAHRPEACCQVYLVPLGAGNVYQIDMESGEIDSFLRLEDDSGVQLHQDDDSGGDLNARIVFPCQKSAVYRVVATTYEAAIGKFTLKIQQK